LGGKKKKKADSRVLMAKFLFVGPEKPWAVYCAQDSKRESC